MSAGSRRDAALSDAPFSRTLNVEKLPDGGLDRTIEASAAECAAIAADLGLAAVNSLAARFHVSPRAHGNVQLSGSFSADIVQVCVVTLDPFESRVEQPVERRFVLSPRSNQASRPGGRSRPTPRAPNPAVPVGVDLGDGADDPPDPVIDNMIDLGAIAVESLCLALDPYPRKQGVQFDGVSQGRDSGSDQSPFAALRPLKDHL